MWIIFLFISTLAHAEIEKVALANLPCEQQEKYPIHLTFDDGPSPQNTFKILDVLKKHGIHATFFVMGEKLSGKQLNQYSKYLERMKADGHTIGTHTYSHIDHTCSKSIHLEAAKQNVDKAWGDFTPASKYLRFPYGNGWWKSRNPVCQKQKEEMMAYIESKKFRHVGWDIDSFDWHKAFRKEAPASILQQICSHKGGIILMHDIQPWTAANLETLIESIEQSGHYFVDINEMQKIHKTNPKVSLEENAVGGSYCYGHLQVDQVRRDCKDLENTGKGTK